MQVSTTGGDITLAILKTARRARGAPRLSERGSSPLRDARKQGIGAAERLCKRVRQADVGADQQPGLTSEEHAEIR